MNKLKLSLLALTSITTSSLAFANTVVLYNPTDTSGLSYSMKSSSEGVCIRMGHQSGVKNSLVRSERSSSFGEIIVSKNESLIVSSSGNIIKQVVGPYAEQVTCIQD